MGEGGGKDFELYDLQKDPGDFCNVADKPEYRAALRGMSGRLAKRKAAAGG